MTSAARAAVARLLNLAVPGGGLILLGRVWPGITIGLLFTICANLMIAATLLFPDDVPGWLRGLSIGLCAGTYLGAQLRVAYYLRVSQQVAATNARDAALREARALLDQGRSEEALAALEPIADLAERDLLVAYRLAQAVTASGDIPRAIEVWERVRRLDRHHLYREVCGRNLATLRSSSPNAGDG